MRLHYIKNFIISLFCMIHDKESKSCWRVIYEIVYLSFYHGRFPVHYFSRYLYRKESGDIKKYVPNKLLYSLHNRTNNVNFSQILDNKLLFNIFFEKYQIRMAKIFFYNHRRMIYQYSGEKNNLNGTDDLRNIVRSYFQKEAKSAIFIKKMCGSHGGSEIYKVCREDLDKPIMDKIFQKIIQSSYIFQEQIQQHKEIDLINPCCINTIRLLSYCDNTHTVHPISGFLRFGIDNAFVDNTSAGGSYVGIDIQTGKLHKNAYSSITKAKGKILQEHPTTKFKFDGYKIPYFDALIGLIKEASLLIPEVKLIGWDIAIQSNGPVLIEGNNNNDLTSHDLINKGFYQNKVFLKIMEELDSMND